MPMWEQYQLLLGAPHLAREARSTPISAGPAGSREVWHVPGMWCVSEHTQVQRQGTYLPEGTGPKQQRRRVPGDGAVLEMDGGGGCKAT